MGDAFRENLDRVRRKFGSGIDAEIPGRWHRENCEIIRDGVYLADAENKAAASWIVNAANTDIAALEEDNYAHYELSERLAADNVKLRARVAELENEHSAKLAAVLRIMRDETEALCYCESDPIGMCLTQCQHCESYERAKAIAEGGE